MRQPLSVSVYIQTALGTGCLDKSYCVRSRECEKEEHRNVFKKHDDSGLIVIKHCERRSEKYVPRNAVFQEQAQSRARYAEKYYVQHCLNRFGRLDLCGHCGQMKSQMISHQDEGPE